MNTTIHLMTTLWGALALQGLALAAGLLLLGRGREGSGVPVLAALGVSGMAASHWLPWVPGLSPQWPSLAFLGALLLPAVVLLQLEHEAGQSVNLWRKATVLVGAFLPAVLLPAQIVGQNLCLLPGQCGPAAPFIVLMHLGTASLLILLSLPALGQLSRQRRLHGVRRLDLSVGGVLITISLVHLFGLLTGLGMPVSVTLHGELAQAAVQLLLMQALSLVSLRPWLTPSAPTPVATQAEALAPAHPANLGAIETRREIVSTLDLDQQAASDMTDIFDAPEVFEATETTEAAAPAPRQLYGDRVMLDQIGQRAIDMLQNEKLYRQPQLRRKDLADKLQVPDYLLSRALNASQGKSFIDLVNGMRLHEAKQRLENGNEAITTIAYDVGFNSLASFNRAFRDNTGHSPSEFRTGQRSKPTDAQLLQAEARAA